MMRRFSSLLLLAIACGAANAQAPSGTPVPDAPQPGAAPRGAETRGVDLAPTAQPRGGPPGGSIFLQSASDDVFASNLIDLEVTNEQSQRIGEIEDLVLDQARNVRAVVLGIGGYRGGNTRRIAVSISALKLNRDAAGKWSASLNATAAQLNAAPEFAYKSGWNEK
jgi:hypothetical protein